MTEVPGSNFPCRASAYSDLSYKLLELYLFSQYKCRLLEFCWLMAGSGPLAIFFGVGIDSQSPWGISDGICQLSSCLEKPSSSVTGQLM